MYITLAEIKKNVCFESIKYFKTVCVIVEDTKEKLSLEQVLKIVDSGIPAKDLVYQVRSFGGENVKQFYVEFAVRRAKSVLQLSKSFEAEKAIKAAEKWLKYPTKENADAAASYAAAADAAASYAAAYAAASAAASDAAASAAASAASAAANTNDIIKDLRELIIKYYDSKLKE